MKHMLSRLAVVGVVLALIGRAQAAPASGTTGYDPVGIAVAELEAEGTPPPDGYTFREAKPGELDRSPARTDSSGKTIIVDTGAIAETLDGHGDASPAALVSAIKMILNHEYQHTEDYGTPSSDSDGYNQDFCQHIAVAETDFDYYCELICAMGDPEARETMCSHFATLVTNFNSYIELREQLCSGGPFYRRGNCVCCE